MDRLLDRSAELELRNGQASARVAPAKTCAPTSTARWPRARTRGCLAPKKTQSTCTERESSRRTTPHTTRGASVTRLYSDACGSASAHAGPLFPLLKQVGCGAGPRAPYAHCVRPLVWGCLLRSADGVQTDRAGRGPPALLERHGAHTQTTRAGAGVCGVLLAGGVLPTTSRLRRCVRASVQVVGKTRGRVCRCGCQC